MSDLTESEIAKNNFLARMSNEMRTPLNAIIGMCTIAQANTDPERISSCLDKINEASLHLLRMINEILDLAKMETGNLILANAEFNLRRMLDKNVEMTKFSLNAKEQILNLEYGPDLPETILSDEQFLSHVLSSLLSNAVKFTPPGGTISLMVNKVREDESTCTLGLWIKDTGIGISEEVRKNLFRVFEQGQGGLRREYGGAGLGLAISYKMVQLMGGEIQVESTLGKGSCFSFEITVQLKEEKKPVIKEDGPKYMGRNFLLAEDVEINREIIIALLEDTGAVIEGAENGRIALDMFKADPKKYSAVIMDIHMPEMDGYEASRQIRAHEKENNLGRIPIIAITANVFQSDVEKSRQAGMDSHLGKPVDYEELLAELDKYLEGE